MLSGFLGQVQADFENLISADFSEPAEISDDTLTVTLPCFFDNAVADFVPQTESSLKTAEPRITVAENATDFNLRRGGLKVKVRGKQYRVRPSDWDFDGLGQLILYLDPVQGSPTP